MIIAGGGPLFVAVPIGSAMLMWDLARIGVVPRTLSIAHAASAIGLVGVTVIGVLYPVTVSRSASR
jgi:hypothetical protein